VVSSGPVSDGPVPQYPVPALSPEAVAQMARTLEAWKAQIVVPMQGPYSIDTDSREWHLQHSLKDASNTLRQAIGFML
jgi:hypothetical protein